MSRRTPSKRAAPKAAADQYTVLVVGPDDPLREEIAQSIQQAGLRVVSSSFGKIRELVASAIETGLAK